MYHFLITLVLLNPDISCLCKQWRFGSVGFWRSQLISIYTVCHSECEFGFWRSQVIWIYTVCHSVCEFYQQEGFNLSDWPVIRNGHGLLIYSTLQGLETDIKTAKMHIHAFISSFLSRVSFHRIPACTQRCDNVASMSMQRHDVASTLMRRCFNVACPLGDFYYDLIVWTGSLFRPWTDYVDAQRFSVCARFTLDSGHLFYCFIIL